MSLLPLAILAALALVASAEPLSRLVGGGNFNPKPIDPLEPWEPTSRGATLARVMKLAGDLELVSSDPQRGVLVLHGVDRELRVWQNRRGGWTDRPGPSFRLENIPSETAELEIHRWNGLWRTLPISSDRVELEDLPEEETLMFLLKK